VQRSVVRNGNFYCVSLCVCAVFAVARCQPVTLVHCIHTAADVVKLLSRSGSPIILVFFTQSADTQFQGEPIHRGAKYMEVGKFCNFQLKLRFISETVRDRPMVAMEC